MVLILMRMNLSTAKSKRHGSLTIGTADEGMLIDFVDELPHFEMHIGQKQ